MTGYVTPTDWKSEKWWRNRPANERAFHLHVPKRWQHITFSDLEIDDRIHDELKSWLSSFKSGDNMYIYGRSGTAKTIIAQALLREIVMKHELSGRFVGSERYIDMLQDSFDNNNLLPEMYSSPYLLKYIQGVFDVVLIDGAGQERNTEFTRFEIGSLIRRRYEDGRSTIITTVMSPVDFSRHYGDRVKMPISEMTPIRLA
jgi:DNA replication protein DnaC